MTRFQSSKHFRTANRLKHHSLSHSCTLWKMHPLGAHLFCLCAFTHAGRTDAQPQGTRTVALHALPIGAYAPPPAVFYASNTNCKKLKNKNPKTINGLVMGSNETTPARKPCHVSLKPVSGVRKSFSLDSFFERSKIPVFGLHEAFACAVWHGKMRRNPPPPRLRTFGTFPASWNCPNLSLGSFCLDGFEPHVTLQCRCGVAQFKKNKKSIYIS